MAAVSLDGATVFATGGGRGIGQAAAQALARAGARVAVCARSADELDRTVQEIQAEGGQALAVVADVEEYAALERAVSITEDTLGPIDILLANAGVGSPPIPLWEVEPDEWWKVLKVNLLGVVHTVRAVVPGMVVRGRGRVITVASYVGVRPSPRLSAYACSKAALLRLTDSLAAELEGTGVTAFAMSPGLVRTAMTEPMAQAENIPDEAFTPIGQGAALIVRLASGEADALLGLLIHATDDLEALIAAASEIRTHGWYMLRLVRGLEGPEQV